MNPERINRLDVGYRVWTEYGLREHGHAKTNVPPKTGGMIFASWHPYTSVDVLLYRVKWDSGQESVHYAKTLFSIGKARSLTEFEEFILAEAVGVELVEWPKGKLRDAKIRLLSGDYVDGLYGLRERLESANISIQTAIKPM
jgi:hypothetical protein